MQTIEMTLIDELQRLGGAVRSLTLRERGFSGYEIRRAVERGQLTHPRRGWVALATLDAELHFAVTHGVILSCVSLARRNGLWVPHKPTELHVASRRNGAPLPGFARVHWAVPLVPRDPDAIVDSLPNTLSLIARCLPREEALTVWESALNKELVDIQSLQRLPLSAAARDLLSECRPYSDSGLESLFKTRLRWLKQPIQPQVTLFGHRVDFLIGDRLVVQIDGRQHDGEQHRSSDYAHDLQLELRGYHVIRVSYTQVMHEWPAVQTSILEALARGWHVAA